MTRRARRLNPEEILHRAVADYLRLALRPPTIWTTIGHGGGGKVRGAKLKAMGVAKGWPDILIMHPEVSLTNVVGIELKADKGRVSESQKEKRDHFADAGAAYQVCRSVDEVELALANYDIPLHATVQARAAA